jgi:divalent anion:Na+ symporter, DASS family
MDACIAQHEAVPALLADPVLRQSHYDKLSRLLPQVGVRQFQAGETLIESGDRASHLYLITRGQVEVTLADGHVMSMTAPCRIGDEAGTDFANYTRTAIAIGDIDTITLPRSGLQRLTKDQSNLKTAFYYALLDGREQAPLPTARAAGKKKNEVKMVSGWLIAILLPLTILLMGRDGLGLAAEAVYYLAMVSSVITMWVFGLVDDYVPCVFAMLVSVVLGLAPPSVVLSGFSSDGFLMAMSILGLGTVMVASGLSYRVLLAALLAVPNTRFWQNLVLVVLGIFLTPTVPSINGRVALMMPSLTDLIEELNAKPGERVATRLSVGMFTGVSLLSGAFLSSKSVNFVVYGLLPSQVQNAFQWSSWLFASSVSALVLLVGYFLIDALLGARTTETTSLSKPVVRAQLRMLGRIKNREWAAIIGISIFIAGVTTASIHKVSPPWLGLTILYGLLLLGFLNKNEFRERIDWPFLIHLSGTVGIISTFNYLGLDKWVAGHLSWVLDYMKQDFTIFLAVLTAVTLTVRLVVPISAAIVLLAAVLIPAAQVYGLHPWVTGFAILILGEIWFLPYQCSYYIAMQDEAAKTGLYDTKRFLLVNAAMSALRIASLYASIPFWKSLGLL